MRSTHRKTAIPSFKQRTTCGETLLVPPPRKQRLRPKRHPTQAEGIRSGRLLRHLSGNYSVTSPSMPLRRPALGTTASSVKPRPRQRARDASLLRKTCQFGRGSGQQAPRAGTMSGSFGWGLEIASSHDVCGKCYTRMRVWTCWNREL